jgi:hypothetical protein
MFAGRLVRRTDMTAMSMSWSDFSLDAYIGDPDTGLLHRVRSGCDVGGGVFYLNWRTAVVHGYDLCACCNPATQPSASAGGGR